MKRTLATAALLAAITVPAYADDETSLQDFQGCLQAHAKNRTQPQLQDCAHNYAPLPERYNGNDNLSRGDAMHLAIPDAHNFAACLKAKQPTIFKDWHVNKEAWRVCLLNAS